MHKILISACLLGSKVRYDGNANFIDHPIMSTWKRENRFIPLCPEVAGGMSVPRAPCEIVSEEPLKIVDINGVDQTQAFLAGANRALNLAKQNRIQFAILKQSSPSCGSTLRYDGTFSGQKIPGMGITAGLLKLNGIQVFDELQVEALAGKIQEVEAV